MEIRRSTPTRTVLPHHRPAAGNPAPRDVYQRSTSEGNELWQQKPGAFLRFKAGAMPRFGPQGRQSAGQYLSARFPGIYQNLSSSNAEVRRDAVRDLVAHLDTETEARQVLAHLAADARQAEMDNPAARRALRTSALEAFSQFDKVSPKEVEILSRALKDEHPVVGHEVATLFGTLAARGNRDALRVLRNQKTGLAASRAADALSKGGDTGDFKSLLKGGPEAHDRLRKAVAAGDREALRVLRESDDPMAAEILSQAKKLSAEDFGQLLSHAFEGSDSDKRLAGELAENKEALKAVRKGLGEGGKSAESAARALAQNPKRISEQDARLLADRARKHESTAATRALAAGARRQPPVTGAMQALKEIADSPKVSSEVREEAREQLRQAFAQSKDQEFRSSVAHHLARTRPKEALPYLAKRAAKGEASAQSALTRMAYRDSLDLDTRRKAVKGLKGPKGVEALAKLATAPGLQRWVRSDAVSALGDSAKDSAKARQALYQVYNGSLRDGRGQYDYNNAAKALAKAAASGSADSAQLLAQGFSRASFSSRKLVVDEMGRLAGRLKKDDPRLKPALQVLRTAAKESAGGWSDSLLDAFRLASGHLGEEDRKSLKSEVERRLKKLDPQVADLVDAGQIKAVAEMKSSKESLALLSRVTSEHPDKKLRGQAALALATPEQFDKLTLEQRKAFYQALRDSGGEKLVHQIKFDLQRKDLRTYLKHDLDGVGRIQDQRDPVDRNNQITSAYWSMGREMQSIIGSDGGANWLNWAAWASHEVGKEIANPVFKDSGGELADGNREIFKNIAPHFARFNRIFRNSENRNNPQAIKEFMSEFDRLEKKGHKVAHLRKGFEAYIAAMNETDTNAKQEHMLRGNLLLGYHEQKNVVDGHLKRSMTSVLGKTGRKLGTLMLMDLRFPWENIRIANDVPGGYPRHLRTIEDPETWKVIKTVDPTPHSTRGSGVSDYSDFKDRIHFIADLFRTRHTEQRLWRYSPGYNSRGGNPKTNATFKSLGRVPDLFR